MTKKNIDAIVKSKIPKPMTKKSIVKEIEEKFVAIYIRVSTDAQVEEGYSVDFQKESLTSYCLSRGWKNIAYYIDGGWSGSNIERPEMQRLIEDSKEGKISAVVIYKLDRLSRSQKDTLYLIEDVFIPNNVDFISTTEALDTSTPMGRAMIGILAAFAQLERENIRIRTRAGMKERVKEGYWMGGGRIPFGYDYDKDAGVLIPNKDADRVRMIYDLYLQGKAPQDIANTLGLSYDRLVTQILKRKSNYGIIEYNGEEYQGRHEPIITKEKYDMAMLEMSRRSKKNIITSQYLLTGLLVCGKCGAKMRYQKWGKGVKLTCYSKQTSKPYLIKDPNCTQPPVPIEGVEAAVIETLFKLQETKKEPEVKIEDSILKSLIERKEALEKSVKKLYNLYANSEDELLLETIQENKQQLDDILNRIKSEQAAIDVVAKSNIAHQSIENLEERWNYMTFQEKQNTVRLLVSSVKITDEDTEIQLSF